MFLYAMAPHLMMSVMPYAAAIRRLYSFPGLTGALPAEWSNLKDSLLFL